MGRRRLLDLGFTPGAHVRPADGSIQQRWSAPTEGDAVVQVSARLSVRKRCSAVSQIVDGFDGSIPMRGMNGTATRRSMPLVRVRQPPVWQRMN